MMDSDNVYQVNRLIYLSISYSRSGSGHNTIVKQNQAEMEELIQRFQAEKEFQKMVESGLKAMELQILSLEDYGLRLSSRQSNSLFAANITDYRKMLGKQEYKTAELLCVHCAIAATFFAEESDLEAPVEDLGSVTIDDVIETLRRFAEAESTLDEEDELLHGDVRTVAARLRELPESNPDGKRSTGNSWEEMCEIILKHMESTKYVQEYKERPGEYHPSPAYQAAMRGGAVYAFNAFRDLLNDWKKEKQNPQKET